MGVRPHHSRTGQLEGREKEMRKDLEFEEEGSRRRALPEARPKDGWRAERQGPGRSGSPLQGLGPRRWRFEEAGDRPPSQLGLSED